MSFLDNLYNRREKLAKALANKEYSGIRQIVEDVGASEAKFILEMDRLVFEHDGRPFDDEDVEGITQCR